MIKAKDLASRKETQATEAINKQLVRIEQNLLRTPVETYFTVVYLPNLEFYILNRIVGELINNGYRVRTETIEGGEYKLSISWGEL